ncbi:sugar transporter ERD6-like 7 [Spinacia oleracea]|uniref:Sugar transporter ERD6-like 7 n=1 Tax=Spinacia oleracea TaxID=3562 RepID=A0ABM3QR02_SPIOL|nr:sugar transporter ERD6-like 7 [Spinacia oleracea]
MMPLSACALDAAHASLNSFVGCRITASLFFQIDSPNSIKKFLKGSLALDIGRLAGGYGMGAFSYVVPVYIAEISPVNLRGALTTLNQVMICTGVSVAFIIGIVLSWRTLALTGLVPCAVLLLGLCFIPESPRWMAKIGSQKEFEAAFQKLRGKDADVTHEAAEIQDYIEELEKMPKANMFDLFQKRYLRSVTVTLEIPWVKWEDGWTWEVKAQLMEAVEWPQKPQDAFERIGTCPPTGVLLFGPPWMQQNAHGPSCSF